MYQAQLYCSRFPAASAADRVTLPGCLLLQLAGHASRIYCLSLILLLCYAVLFRLIRLRTLSCCSCWPPA